jgi:phenylalanyl-tRNA synthetase alpha chain
VFRQDAEDASHQKVFHQFDGLCIKKGADIDELRNVIGRIIEATLGSVKVRFTEISLFDWVEPGFEVGVEYNGRWIEIAGGGMLKSQVVRERGYDPDSVSGFNFGFGLDRLAMIKLGIDDIRQLWKPPYVPE